MFTDYQRFNMIIKVMRFAMEKEFLSIAEVAIIFGVSKTAIYSAVKKGFLIGVRIGDAKKSPYRISRKSIEAIHSSICKQLSEKSKKI